MFGIIHASENSWASPVTIGSFGVGVVLLVALVWNESVVAQPIMPLRLFADPVRVGGYIGRTLYMGAMIGFFFGAQYLQEALGMNSLQAGMAFFPMTLVNFAVALLFPRIAPRMGEAWPLVIGFGQGPVFAPLTSAVISGASAADAGAASGLVNTFHQLGTALGLGLLVALSPPACTAAGADEAVAVSAEASAAFAGASGMLALCLIVCASLILPREIAARRR